MSKTIGQEIMRVDFSRDDEVRGIKEMYAKIYDECVKVVQRTQDKASEPPSTLVHGNITEHMEVIRVAEETMRCAAEASKFIELACMFHVKALTS